MVLGTRVHASTIRLDGLWLVTVACLVALVLVVLVPWQWDAWRHRRLGRSATVLVAVLAVVGGAGLIVNRLGVFYPTLGSLLGSSPNPAEGTQAEAGADGNRLDATMGVVAQRSADGKGTLIHLTVTGARSRLVRDMDIYLPPGYSSRAWAGSRFPVIEWIPHFPGQPRAIPTEYGLPALLDADITARRMPPTVVLVPDPNGEPRLTHDSECVDAVAGPADDTYLTADVRHWALHHLRVRGDRASWAIAGWSSGGYCAVNLAVRHPQWYGMAVSMSGDVAAPHDLTTGDLFHGRTDVRDANNVVINLHRHPADVRILASADGAAPDELGSLARLLAAATPPTQLTTWLFPPEGHNLRAVRDELPTVLDWLGAQLPYPEPAAAAGGVQAHVVARRLLPSWPLPDTGNERALHGTTVENDAQ